MLSDDDMTTPLLSAISPTEGSPAHLRFSKIEEGDCAFKDDDSDDDLKHVVVCVGDNPAGEKRSPRAWQPLLLSKTSFLPALEGLRGVAVLATLAAHLMRQDIPRQLFGSFGVNTFFVLSGFLITGVLIRLQVSLAE